MSWFSDNYEKVALGGAAVVALALGAVIYSNKDAVEESFTLDSVKPNNNVNVPGLAEMETVKVSLSKKHTIDQPDIDGRKVDLMTGVPLFAKRGDPKNPVDLLKSAPVHPPIPNKWWLDNEIDPGYSDSPERDPDKDGFSNREEYVAKTDPNEFKSHPNPVTKLIVTSVKTTQYHLKPADYGGDKYKFKLQNSRGIDRNKMGMNPIEAGKVIPFTGPLMQNRFKFKGIEEKEIKKSGITQMAKIWIIEDLQPNKKGVVYRFDKKGKRVGEDGNRVEGGPIGIIDSTVELTLQALAQGGSPFKVEENTRFSLPFDEKATEKPYLLKAVDVKTKTVEIEYTDKEGNTKSLSLSYAK